MRAHAISPVSRSAMESRFHLAHFAQPRTNSSPPSRAVRSICAPRAEHWDSGGFVTGAWPSTSLTALKLSRSTNSSAELRRSS